MSMTGVLFDLDNTLMDRDWTFRKFTEQLVSDHLGHLPMNQQEELIEYIIESDADGYRQKEGFFQELIDRLPWANQLTMSELKAYYEANYMIHAKVMKYTQETLSWVKSQGLKLGLITNGYTNLQNNKIDCLKLRTYFDIIVISEEVGIRKPDERIYHKALELLGTKPEETILVGDHPVNDIWGAARLGIRGVWLRRNHDWSIAPDGEPWKQIDELNELTAIIDEEQMNH